MNPREIYQKYLNDEFQRRQARNLQYSLRAFARDLAVPAPKLSQYMNGTCGLSAHRASEIAQKLKLNSVESELFVCSAEAAHARVHLKRKQASERLQLLLRDRFLQIDMEKFKLIQDWYHLAILELTELDGFKQNTDWIAEALGISKAQSEEAVERLEKLGLLKREPQKWVQTDQDLETPPDFSSQAIREYHHQMIRLVDSRFEGIPVDHREMGSVVFGVDKDLVPDFKKLVRRFQKDAAALAAGSRKKNALYVCNLQFMPIFEPLDSL